MSSQRQIWRDYVIIVDEDKSWCSRHHTLVLTWCFDAGEMCFFFGHVHSSESNSWKVQFFFDESTKWVLPKVFLGKPLSLPSMDLIHPAHSVTKLGKWMMDDGEWGDVFVCLLAFSFLHFILCKHHLCWALTGEHLHYWTTELSVFSNCGWTPKHFYIT